MPPNCCAAWDALVSLVDILCQVVELIKLRQFLWTLDVRAVGAYALMTGGSLVQVLVLYVPSQKKSHCEKPCNQGRGTKKKAVLRQPFPPNNRRARMGSHDTSHF